MNNQLADLFSSDYQPSNDGELAPTPRLNLESQPIRDSALALGASPFSTGAGIFSALSGIGNVIHSRTGGFEETEDLKESLRNFHSQPQESTDYFGQEMELKPYYPEEMKDSLGIPYPEYKSKKEVKTFQPVMPSEVELDDMVNQLVPDPLMQVSEFMQKEVDETMYSPGSVHYRDRLSAITSGGDSYLRFFMTGGPIAAGVGGAGVGVRMLAGAASSGMVTGSYSKQAYDSFIKLAKENDAYTDETKELIDKSALGLAVKIGGLEFASNILDIAVTKGIVGIEAKALRNSMTKGPFKKALIEFQKQQGLKALKATAGLAGTIAVENFIETSQELVEQKAQWDVGLREEEVAGFGKTYRDMLLNTAISVSVFHGLNAPMASYFSNGDKRQEVMGELARMEALEAGLSPKQADVVKSKTMAMTKRVDEEVMAKKAGVNNWNEVELLKSHGVTPIEMVRMDGQLKEEILEELKAGDHSDSLNSWRNEKKSKTLELLDKNFLSNPEKMEYQLFEDLSMPSAEAKESFDKAGIPEEDQIAAWNVFTGMALGSGKTPEKLLENYVFERKEEDKDKRFPWSFQEEEFNKNSKASVEWNWERIRQAKNLKDATDIFKDTFGKAFPGYTAILDAIQDTNFRLNQKLAKTPMGTDPDGDYGSVEWSPDTGSTTQLNLNEIETYKGDPKEMAKTFMHEFFHVVLGRSVRQLEDVEGNIGYNKPVAEALTKLGNSVKAGLAKRIAESDLSEDEKFEVEKAFEYTLDKDGKNTKNIDPEEFVSFLFSSSVEQRRLVLSIMPRDFVARNSLGSKISRALFDGKEGNQVVDQVSQVLGMILDPDYRQENEKPTLYQMLGFHGSGALYDQPSKAFRKTGEKTMWEGAGKYFVEILGLKGEKNRAKWYAEAYPKEGKKWNRFSRLARKLDVTEWEIKEFFGRVNEYKKDGDLEGLKTYLTSLANSMKIDQVQEEINLHDVNIKNSIQKIANTLPGYDAWNPAPVGDMLQDIQYAIEQAKDGVDLTKRIDEVFAESPLSDIDGFAKFPSGHYIKPEFDRLYKIAREIFWIREELKNTGESGEPMIPKEIKLAIDNLYDLIKDSEEGEILTRVLYELKFAEGKNRLENMGQVELSSKQRQEIRKQSWEEAHRASPWESVVEGLLGVHPENQGLVDLLSTRGKDLNVSYAELMTEITEYLESNYPKGSPYSAAQEVRKGIAAQLTRTQNSAIEIFENLKKEKLEEMASQKDKFSEKDSGWLWKDLDDYIMLDWDEAPPVELLEAIEKRLVEYPPYLASLDPETSLRVEAGLTKLDLELAQRRFNTGEKLYRFIENNILADDHAVSEFFDSIGILGTSYSSGSGRGRNAVAYNEDRVRIVDRTLFQEEKGIIKGSTTFLKNGKAFVQFFPGADFSTIVEEFTHVYYEQTLSNKKKMIISKAAIGKDHPTDKYEYRDVQEYFAKNFLRYLAEGKAPTSSLQRLYSEAKVLLLTAYKKASRIFPNEIKPEVRAVFDSMMVSTEMKLVEKINQEVRPWNRETMKLKHSLKYGKLNVALKTVMKGQTLDDSKDLFTDTKALENMGLITDPDIATEVQEEIKEAKTEAGIINTIEKGVAKERRVRQDAAVEKARKSYLQLRSNEKFLKPKVQADLKQLLDGINPGRDRKNKGWKSAKGLIDYVRGLHDEIPDAVWNAVEKASKIRLNEMDLESLESLSTALDRIHNETLQLKKKQFLAKERSYNSLIDEGREVLQGQERTRDAKAESGRSASKAFQIYHKVTSQMRKAEFILRDTIERGKEGVFKRVWIDEVNKGEDEGLRWEFEVEDYLKDAMEGIDLNMLDDTFHRPGLWPQLLRLTKGKRPEYGLTRKQRQKFYDDRVAYQEFTLDSGETIKLSPSEMIDLYLSASNESSYNNIITGGILLDETDEGGLQPAIKITESDLDYIFGSMDGGMLSLAQVFYNYYNKMERPAINETSTKVGLAPMMAGIEHYYPKWVERAGSTVSQVLKQSSSPSDTWKVQIMQTLEGLGKWKRRSEHNNPIIITSAFQRLARSKNVTKNYIAYAEVLRKMKVMLRDGTSRYNAGTPDAKTNLEMFLDGDDVSVNMPEEIPGIEALIKDRAGETIYTELKRYIDRLEGGVGGERMEVEMFAEEIRRNLVMSIIGVNPFMAAKQVASIEALVPELFNGEHAIQAQVIASRAAAETFSKNNPWTQERMEAISPQMRERFKHSGHRDVYEAAIKSQVRDLYKKQGTTAEMLFKEGDLSKAADLIRRMDMLAISATFRAAELELKAEGKPVTDEAVKYRAEELVRLTQPTYHRKDRSSMTASTNVWMRLVTSFGSVRNVYFNQMLRQMGRGNFAGYALFATFNAALMVAVNTTRAITFGYTSFDDLPEEVPMSMLSEVLKGTIGTHFFYEVFPGLLQLTQTTKFSGLEGNNLLSDYFESFRRAQEKVVDPGENFSDTYKFLELVLQANGIPAKNVRQILGAGKRVIEIPLD